MPYDRHEVEPIRRRDPSPGVVMDLTDDQVAERPVDIDPGTQVACRRRA